MGHLNLSEIDQEEALFLSKFYISSGKNCFFFGKKGLGKTSIAIEAVKQSGYKLTYINLSVLERSDLCGFPNITNNSEYITYKLPHYLPKLDKKPDNVIIFDEIDKAPSEVTAPLLEILQFRKINGISLNIVSCILTGNLQDEHTFSNQISTAILDRGAKYILSFSFDKWLDWAKANNIHDLILGFLRNNPEFACSKQDDLYASPSPRGWTLASDALIKAKALKITEISTITQIISGFVGSEAGLRFKLWYEYFRKFESYINSLIDSGSMSLDFDSLIPTEKMIFVISACFYAKQKVTDVKTKNKFKYLDNLCIFLNSYNIESEVKVIGLSNSFSFDQITKHKLYENKEFFDLFTKINEGVQIAK